MIPIVAHIVRLISSSFDKVGVGISPADGALATILVGCRGVVLGTAPNRSLLPVAAASIQ